MAKQKTFRPPLVPVELDADIDVARWLARESFETAAARDGMTILQDTWTEREVSAASVPQQWAEFLGRPLADFLWFEFRAVGQVDEDVFNWLAAENTWQRDQTAAWIKAEKAHASRA